MKQNENKIRVVGQSCFPKVDLVTCTGHSRQPKFEILMIDSSINGVQFQPHKPQEFTLNLNSFFFFPKTLIHNAWMLDFNVRFMSACMHDKRCIATMASINLVHQKPTNFWWYANDIWNKITQENRKKYSYIVIKREIWTWELCHGRLGPKFSSWKGIAV